MDNKAAEGPAIKQRRFVDLKEIRQEKETLDGEAIDVVYMTPAVFEQLSDPIFYFEERIEHGAFAAAIGRDDTRALIDHWSHLITGRTKSKALSNGEMTLNLWEEADGLKSKNWMPDTSYARDLLVNIGRGDITQGSFQFTPGRERWEGDVDNPVNVVEEIGQLWDISYVTFPAYPQTHIDYRALFDMLGIDHGAAREIVAKRNLGKEPTNVEQNYIKAARAVFDSLLAPEAGARMQGIAEEADIMQVQDIDVLRWRFVNARAALEING